MILIFHQELPNVFRISGISLARTPSAVAGIRPDANGQVRLLTQKRFGASSEKSSPDQYGLFNEAEQDLPEDTDAIESAEAEIIVPAHQRKKAGRRPLPAHLSRIREEHGLPEDEKVFSCCGNQNLHRIGEEVSE